MLLAEKLIYFFLKRTSGRTVVGNPETGFHRKTDGTPLGWAVDELLLDSRQLGNCSDLFTLRLDLLVC